MNYRMGSTGIAVLMRARPRLSSRRFVGDFAAADILLDLDRAIRQAQLTDRQAMVIKLVFTLDMTQQEAAFVMQVSQEAIHKTQNKAISRIAQVFQRWNDHDQLAIRGGGNHEARRKEGA